MLLPSYFTPGHVAIDMGVFPSAGVREYACSGLYLVVDPGAGTAQSHIHRSFHYVDHEVAKTNRLCPSARARAREREEARYGRVATDRERFLDPPLDEAGPCTQCNEYIRSTFQLFTYSLIEKHELQLK